MSAALFFTIIAVYLIGIPVTHFIVCYQEAKPDNKGGYTIKTDSLGLIIASFMWPIILLVVIVNSPFSCTKKLALKLKKASNPKQVNLNPFNNNE